MDSIHLVMGTLLMAALGIAGRLYHDILGLRRRLKRLRKQGRVIQERLQHSTQKRRTETESRESTEGRLRRYLSILDTLINTIAHPIYFKDQAGVFRGCNQAFAQEIMGLSRSAIIDQQGRDLDAGAPQLLLRELDREERQLSPRGPRHTFEASVQGTDGKNREFLISLSLIPTDTEHGSGCVGVLLDMTDRNRAAVEQAEREKFQGVIETAGAVCHELNQPLQALTGYAEMLLDNPSVPAELQRITATIQSQVRRMADITGKLQRITHYKTQSYGNGATIIDIHKASQSDLPIRERSNPEN
jgi:PAS domain S-box-containing protein